MPKGKTTNHKHSFIVNIRNGSKKRCSFLEPADSSNRFLAGRSTRAIELGGVKRKVIKRTKTKQSKSPRLLTRPIFLKAGSGETYSAK